MLHCRREDGWWVAENENGVTGLVPGNHFEVSLRVRKFLLLVFLMGVTFSAQNLSSFPGLVSSPHGYFSLWGHRMHCACRSYFPIVVLLLDHPLRALCWICSWSLQVLVLFTMRCFDLSSLFQLLESDSASEMVGPSPMPDTDEDLPHEDAEHSGSSNVSDSGELLARALLFILMLFHATVQGLHWHFHHIM